MLSTPAMGANHLDTSPYFVPDQVLSSSDTVAFPSADPSLILTPDPSTVYRQHVTPEWPYGHSTRRGSQSMSVHAVSPELSYATTISESYASSEICYSPISALMSPSSVSAANPQSYSTSYDYPTSHPMTTPSGVADPFIDAQQFYVADPALSGVGNDSLLPQPYGSVDTANSLCDTSSGVYGEYHGSSIVSSLPSPSWSCEFRHRRNCVDNSVGLTSQEPPSASPYSATIPGWLDGTSTYSMDINYRYNNYC